VSSSDIDGWLRGLNLAAKSRSGMLICVKVLFSFACSHNCLPADQMTAAEQIKKVKVKDDGSVSVFTPEEMEKLLHTAPPHLIPILAIGAFSCIRMAELNRLNWSAFDLERCLIELRAGQAKTASRRIIPIILFVCHIVRFINQRLYTLYRLGRMGFDRHVMDGRLKTD